MLHCVRVVFAMFVLTLSAVSLDASETKPAVRPIPYKVLFIGNSHLFVNDVPGQVRRLLQALKGSVSVRAITKGGARLLSFTRRPDVAAALNETAWDVVVLQEASATFVSTGGSERFHKAIDWFERRIPQGTRIVLYQTWPWREGSRYLRKYSATEIAMWGVMRREYAKVARRPRIRVAPVGPCWLGSPRLAALYSADGNHASPAGSRLAAAVIARTIEERGEKRC